MLEIIIYLITILFILFNKKFYGRYVTAFTIIMLPYVAILFINNNIATHFKFYEINTNTQFMILLSILCFFVGTVISLTIYQKSNKNIKRGKEHKITNVLNMKLVTLYVGAVLIIRILQILFKIYLYGLAAIEYNDFELLISRGPVSHLELSIFPLTIIMIGEYYDTKKKKYLIMYLIFAFLCFIETEKARILSLVIATFLYLVLKNEKLLVKGVIGLVSIVAILFISNYIIKLTIQGYASHIEGVYYTYRLWNYIGGSVINSNWITNYPNLVKTNAFDYVIDCLLTFPNLFINKIMGFTIGPNVGGNLPFIGQFPAVTYATGYRYQDGNVVSTITLFYGNGNLLAFIPVCIAWGMLCEAVYIKMNTNQSNIKVVTCICFFTFSFLTFFGGYYGLSSFYERLIWCGILGFVLNKNTKFKFM